MNAVRSKERRIVTLLGMSAGLHLLLVVFKTPCLKDGYYQVKHC